MTILQWKNLGIGTRIIVITVLPVVLMFIAFVSYSYHSRIIEVQDELAERGSVLATVLAESSEYGIISGNFSDLERIAYGLVEADSNIYKIELMDANKRKVLHVTSRVQRDAESRVFEVPIKRQLIPIDLFPEEGTPHVSGFSAIPSQTWSSNHIVGYARVTMSPSDMFTKQIRRAYVQSSMALFALLVSILFALYLSRSLTVPMAAAINAIRKIRSGNYAVYVKVTTGGEIGDLQSSLNEMSESLERTKDLEISRNEALKSDAEKRKLIQKVNSAVEDERKSIAIEIHDELNATLIAARLNSQRILAIAQNADDDSDMAEIKDHAESIITLTSNLYASARNIVRRLRPEVLDMLGLQGAIEEMMHTYDVAHPDCRFEFESIGDFSKLKSDLAIAVYRLVQEALSNVVKHATASRAQVSLLLDKEIGILHVSVTDNGTGFDPVTITPGIGIIGMRERVHAFNGQIDIRSDANNGTEIKIRLPI